MTNLEKCNAGIEYSYADEELIALKTPRLRDCESNKYSKSRVPKSRSQRIMQFNFEQLLK